MLEQVGKKQGIDILFEKLGHSLPEIRTRALNSIISKLDHGILHETDLVQEQCMFDKLLKWFSFDTVPMKEEVTKLLRRFSRYARAREFMISLDGVQIFSSLRENTSPSLKVDVDLLLESLLHTNDAGPSTSKHFRNDNDQDVAKNRSQRNTTGTSLALMIEPDTFSGYFEDSVESQAHEVRHPRHEDRDIPSFVTFPGFPWHFLTATDRHVLSSTSVSLCSSNTSLIQNACSFLLDVVLRDFPTEIFLHRPSIINTLLTLLRSRPSASLNSIACDCITYIASNLVSRILFYQNPDFFCPRQGLPLHKGSFLGSSDLNQYGSLDDDGQELNGGDGRDENSTSSTFASSIQKLGGDTALFSLNQDDASLGDDHMAALQLSQLSVHQFCVSCLQTSVPLMLIDSPNLFFKAFEIADNCVRILEHILDIDALWKSEDNSAKSFQKDVESISDLISRGLLYHYHLQTEGLHQKDAGIVDSKYCKWKSKSKSKNDMVFHRAAFHSCSILLLKFMSTVLEVSNVQYLRKDTIDSAMYVLGCDKAFQILFPTEAKLAEAYLSECCEDKCSIARRVKSTIDSISDIHNFLRCDEYSLDNAQEMINLVENGLNALPYYDIEKFVPQAVTLISDLCGRSQLNAESKVARTLLLKLFAYPQTNIRSSAYHTCLRIVTQATSVSANADCSMLSTQCSFLIDDAVLYEVILHGMADSSALVNTSAKDLVLKLLRGKLVIEQALWAEYVSCIKNIMTALLTYLGDDGILKSAIFDFMLDNFQHQKTFECLYKCLLLKQRKLRIAASGMLIKALASYKRELIRDGHELNESFQVLDNACNTVDLTDLFIVDEPLSLTNSLSGVGNESGLFQEDIVVRMLGVFQSKTISHPVRQSALQQLAVILNDQRTHNVFLRKNGLEVVKNHIIKVATKPVLTDTERSETSSCLSILKILATIHGSIRNSLNENTLTMALFKLADLCRLCPVTISLISQLMALVLMTDVIQERTEDGSQTLEISLPSRIISHFQIPFLCRAHDVISKNRITSVSSDGNDPLLSGPPAFAIRSGIVLAQNGGNLSDAIRSMQERKLKSDSYQPLSKNELEMILVDQIALLSADPGQMVDYVVTIISNADNHNAVCFSLLLIRIMLRTSPNKYTAALLENTNWQLPLEKFFTVLPSSMKDVELLLDVVNMMYDVLNSIPSKCSTANLESTLLWYMKMCVQEPTDGHLVEMPLLSLLHSSGVQNDQANDATSSIALQRQLCKAILAMVSCISRKFDVITDKTAAFRLQAMMCQITLVRLKLADTPRFYDLPSMEVTLDCLVHVTASSGWTNTKPLDLNHSGFKNRILDGALLCSQLLTSLLEVVSAFHIENRGSSMSYMGKGVSKAATQSIVHLVFEIAGKKDAQTQRNQEWLNIIGRAVSLSHVKKQDEKSSGVRLSFEWIMALWSARDPRIRYSGLALGTALTSTFQGCHLIQNNFKKYTGGIWSMTFSIFSDGGECPAVRSQAASILCNLACYNFENHEENSDFGIFLAFLSSSKTAQIISEIIARYHSSFFIQPSRILYTPYVSSMSISGSDNSFPSVKSTGPTGHNISTASKSTHQGLNSVVEGDTTYETQRDDHTADSQQSESTYSSEFPAEWLSVSTPKLISSLCKLLKNIMDLSKDTVIMLRRDALMEQLGYLIDASLLNSYIEEFHSENISYGIGKGRLRLTAIALFEQYADTCDLLNVYARNEKVLAFSLLQDSRILSQVVNLVTIKNLPLDWIKLKQRMQKSAIDFLNCLMYQCKADAAAVIRQMVSESWQSYAESAELIITESDGGSPLLRSLMCMLTNMLSPVAGRNQPQPNVASTHDGLFDNPSAELDCNKFTLNFAVMLETQMLKTDSNSLDMMMDLTETLQVLFLRFPSCKDALLDKGFLENLIGEIKHIHSQLALLAIAEIQNNLSSTVKKLLLLLRTLGCFVEGNEDVQNSASDIGVGNVLQNLWSWSTQYPKIKASLLKLATCYTANCEKSCSSLSVAAPGHQPLFTSILGEAEDVNAKILVSSKVQIGTLKSVYHLLFNLSLSRDCRVLLWKSGFLNRFPAVANKGQHPKCSKLQRKLLEFWLKLLHCLSFFGDGQANILKILGVLEVLASIYTSTGHHDIILKILCNVCYHGPSKPRISSNKVTLDVLTSSLSSQSGMHSASAIWALLSSNQKSRNHLRLAGLTPKILASLASLKLSPEENEKSDFGHRLTAILDALKSTT